tara:strand:+ start:318 stop:1340 length:1023 start_codon:yes stop_codon:yes gene_type:complete
LKLKNLKTTKSNNLALSKSMKSSTNIFIVLFIGLSGMFLFISSQNDLSSIYKQYYFRRNACKKSLTRTAEALVEDKLHISCLSSAQQKAYKAGSRLRTQLKQYPPELQRVFLEVLNRRLNGNRSYKKQIHPLFNLRPVIEKYFIHPENLQMWWQDQDEVLNFLAQVKIKTPPQQKIHYFSLNKFYKHHHPNAYKSPDFKPQLDHLYSLLARIHYDGTNTALHNLKTLRHHSKNFPAERLQYIEKRIKRIEDDIKAIYKACYHPPNTNNNVELPAAIERLSQDQKTLEALKALQSHLHKLEKKPSQGTRISHQHFSSLDLLIDILVTLKSLHQQATQTPAS